MGAKSSKQKLKYQLRLEDKHNIQQGVFVTGTGLVCVPMLTLSGEFLQDYPQWLRGRVDEKKYSALIQRINNVVRAEANTVTQMFLDTYCPDRHAEERYKLELDLRRIRKDELIEGTNVFLTDINNEPILRKSGLSLRYIGSDPRDLSSQCVPGLYQLDILPNH
eukprot:343832_1